MVSRQHSVTSAPTTRSRDGRCRKTSASVLVIAVVGLSTAMLVDSSSASATSFTSFASARFLSGSIAGTSLDTIAGIQGESAVDSSGVTVTNANSLDAELLDDAIKIPLANGLQLPGLDILKLGAASQYASARADGSAVATSGAVLSNGGIALGGTAGVPANATLDLSGLGGAALSGTLGNLKLTVGALSAQAQQESGMHGAQAGAYQIANLDLSLTSPLLSGILDPVVTAVGATLSGLAAALDNLKLGVVQVVGVPDLAKIASSFQTLSLAGGAIVISLASGGINVDLGKLLASLNLNLDEMPVGTSLLPYLLTALQGLPQAVADLVNNLQATLAADIGGIGLAIGACATPPVATSNCVIVDGSAFTKAEQAVVAPILTALASGVAGIGATLTSLGQPLLDALGSLAEICVNQEGGAAAPAPHDAGCAVAGGAVPAGEFVQRAVQIDLVAGAGDPLVELNLAQAAVGPSSAIVPTPTSPTSPTSPAGPAASPALAFTGTDLQGLWLSGTALLCLGLALLGATIGVPASAARPKRR